MHIVIADDLTGAAEIAGVGLSRGLKGLVSTTLPPEDNSDLLCLATDTRSFTQEDASKSINHYTTALKRLNPKHFYKKIDSVLRGNVMHECDAFAKAQGLDKIIIIPANPSLNRIVKNGIYYINNVPLAETNLFRGKKQSSKVLDLIHPAYRNQTRVIKEVSELNGPGFFIGEVEDYTDLLKWAALSNEPIALCGGSDFFDALLQYQFYNLETSIPADIPFGERQLFILGSAMIDNDFHINEIADQGFIVCNMPWPIFNNSAFSGENIDQWVKEILAIYQTSNKLVITMNYKDLPYKERPHLKLALGEMINTLIKQIAIDELFVEGGATSYAILKEMQADRLTPVQDLARGVTRMELLKYKPLKMTVKPGSYKWPDAIWPKLKNLILK